MGLEEPRSLSSLSQLCQADGKKTSFAVCELVPMPEMRTTSSLSLWVPSLPLDVDAKIEVPSEGEAAALPQAGAVTARGPAADLRRVRGVDGDDMKPLYGGPSPNTPPKGT